MILRNLILFLFLFLLPCNLRAWTMIMFPDPHLDRAASTSTYASQCKWVVDNYSDKVSTTVVFLVGDLITDRVEAITWTYIVGGIMKIVDANIPMIIARGNHDPRAQYLQYIDYATFYSDRGWFDGGVFDSGVDEPLSYNCYFKLTIEGTKYLFITLEYTTAGQASTANRNLDWAESILLAHADHHIILCVHEFLAGNSSGVRTTGGSVFWEGLVTKYKNVDLILCGHLKYTDRASFINPQDNKGVTAILFNAQSSPNNWNESGWMRILTIDNTAKTVSAESYSVILDSYNTGVEYDFTMDYGEAGAAPVPQSIDITLGNDLYHGIEIK